MTYLDKFKQDHPDHPISRSSGGVPSECPHHYGYPVLVCNKQLHRYSNDLFDFRTPCWDCWHKEFPEQEENGPKVFNQIKMFLADKDKKSYEELEADVNKFLRGIPEENLVSIHTSETDCAFTVMITYVEGRK